MTEAIIISSAILLILLWLGFKEADREYMECLCGKQPTLKTEEFFGSCRYVCDNCELESHPGRTKSDAQALWHNMIQYYKKYGNKK